MMCNKNSANRSRLRRSRCGVSWLLWDDRPPLCALHRRWRF